MTKMLNVGSERSPSPESADVHAERDPLNRHRSHSPQAIAAFVLLLWALHFAGCTQATPDSTAFAADSGSDDVATDAADEVGGDNDSDAVAADAAGLDTQLNDSTPSAVVPSDTGLVDGGPADSGPPDAGSADTGPGDTGPPDTSGCNSAGDCDDNRVCTIDLCNPSDHTCDHKPHTGACNDGDPCTNNDVCSGGSCKGGPAKLVRQLVAAKGVTAGGATTVVSGQVALAGQLEGKGVVLGFDSTHNVAWTTEIGYGLEGGMHCIAPAPVTGYIVGGWRKQPTSTLTDGYIAHVGQTGTLQAGGKILGTSTFTEVRALLKKSSSHMFFAGTTHDGKNNSAAMYGTYSVSQGQVAGTITYLGNASDRRAVNAMVQVGSNNVLVGWSPKTAYKQGWLQGLNVQSGFTTFDVSHGSSVSAHVFYDAAATSDGGMLATGSTAATVTGLSNVWLLRTDSGGKKLWTRSLGSDAIDIGVSILATGGGGVLIAGTGAFKTQSNAQGALWQVDAWGNVVWQRTTNLSGGERLVALTADAGAVLVSGHNQATTGDKFVMMWVDAFGHSTCSDSGVCAQKKLADCDDGKICTADDCDAGKGCIHAPLTKSGFCGVSKTCDGVGGCP